jgi:hypothetical protein
MLPCSLMPAAWLWPWTTRRQISCRVSLGVAGDRRREPCWMCSRLLYAFLHVLGRVRLVSSGERRRRADLALRIKTGKIEGKKTRHTSSSTPSTLYTACCCLTSSSSICGMSVRHWSVHDKRAGYARQAPRHCWVCPTPSRFRRRLRIPICL